MRRILAALAATLVVLAIPAVAAAHHGVDSQSGADCTGVKAQFAHFSFNDGSVSYSIKVDGTIVKSGVIPTFNGDKTFADSYPSALQGPSAHTVVFSSTWGGGSFSFTRTVTGCPAPTPPKNCPNEPPTSPCNCPPGPKGEPGKDGVTTTIIVHETTVVYVDKTCTSARVFHFKIGARLPHDDAFEPADVGHRIVSAVVRYRTKISAAGQPYKEGIRTTKAKKDKNGRLRVDADYRGVVAPKGQVRSPKLHVKLDNGHWLWLGRKVRLCLGRDGDLNYPSDLPQNGHPGGATGSDARVAKKSSAHILTAT